MSLLKMRKFCNDYFVKDPQPSKLKNPFVNFKS